MNKLTIPAILVATVMVAGIFAFMPIEKASTVHTTIQNTIGTTTGNNIAVSALTAGTDQTLVTASTGSTIALGHVNVNVANGAGTLDVLSLEIFNAGGSSVQVLATGGADLGLEVDESFALVQDWTLRLVCTTATCGTGQTAVSFVTTTP